jgi:hypothetical protein
MNEKQPFEQRISNKLQRLAGYKSSATDENLAG